VPKVPWGIGAEVIDDFDRDSQYKPYTGPIPPNAVYRWNINKLQYVAGTREKHPQLRVGLALIPRNADEETFNEYFVMDFIPVTDRTAFRYVPFLDAIGVTATDFTARTLSDEEGNIKRIGKWRNTGEETVMGLLKDAKPGLDGTARKEIGTYVEDTTSEEDEYYPDDADDEEIDEDDYADEDEDDAEYEDEEEDEPEPTPPPRRARSSTTRDGRQARRSSRDPF
jgi:hypothetical protein